MAKRFDPGQSARRNLCLVRDRPVAVVRHHAAGQYRAWRSDRAFRLCRDGRRPRYRPRPDHLPRDCRAADVCARLRDAAGTVESDPERRAAAAAARNLRHFDHHSERAVAGLWRLYPPAPGRRDRNCERATSRRHLDRRLSADGLRRGRARARQSAVAVLPNRPRPGLSRRVGRCRYGRVDGGRQPQALCACLRHRDDLYGDRRHPVCDPNKFRSRRRPDPSDPRI